MSSTNSVPSKSSSTHPPKKDEKQPSKASSSSTELVIEEGDEQHSVAPPHFLDQAFEETTDRFAKAMPWIMHGSGDVEPSKVDPTAAHFLASLTAQYTAKLVNAAVDTFAMFLNNQDEDNPYCVPPPPLKQARIPAPPQPLVEREPPGAPIILKANNERKPPRKKPKRKMRQEYWDEPLPEPKIRSKTTTTEEKDSARQAATKKTRFDDNQDEVEKQNADKQNHPPIEQWVGAIGVDFHADSIRRAHMPLGLSTPSFVFPICHDVYAYNKTRHIQAAKRGTVDPLLQDSTVQDLIKEEKLSRYQKKVAVRTPEEEDVEEVVDPPAWPDMESLLMPGFIPGLDLSGIPKDLMK